jgi:predicted AAA+ superfamily ATPase
MLYSRTIQPLIEKDLFSDRAVIIYGARRVGKTTLVKNILDKYQNLKTRYISCDEQVVRDGLAVANSGKLYDFIGGFDLVVLDEAQRIEDIGIKLKLLVDNYPKLQLLVTASSSLDLSNKINESLTGRKLTHMLYPLSVKELGKHWSELLIDNTIERILKYGAYPSVLLAPDMAIAEREIKNITSDYLYKDVLEYQDIRNPEQLYKILRALALQVGKEVSMNELAQTVGLNNETVTRYVWLLEQCFVIFKLNPLSKNPRNEITKTKKIYFYDLGVLNSLLDNFNSIDIRPDKGGLWENFCILERKKNMDYMGSPYRPYFWRNYAQAEIDYIEEVNNAYDCFEFKYSPNKKSKIPAAFATNYNVNKYQVINSDNWYEFIY